MFDSEYFDVNKIQYVGVKGITKDCADAVLRMIQYGDKIKKAWILSCRDRHCILLLVNECRIFAVKTGFSSGYNGEGPRTFSYIISVLDAHGIEIDEYDVRNHIFDRINKENLRKADIAFLKTLTPLPASSWFGYIWDRHKGSNRDKPIWHKFPLCIPYNIIDSRIMDLALEFLDNPDHALITGYRRLEDIIKTRTNINGNRSRAKNHIAMAIYL